jgi:hypothetical protein
MKRGRWYDVLVVTTAIVIVGALFILFAYVMGSL